MKIESKFNIGDYIWYVKKNELSLQCVRIHSIEIIPTEIFYNTEDHNCMDDLIIFESDIGKIIADKIIQYFFDAQAALDYLKSLLEEKENEKD